MKKYILLVFLLSMMVCARAEQGGPGLPGDDPDVPVDGGIGFMLLAGAAYGVKKIKDLRRDENER